MGVQTLVRTNNRTEKQTWYGHSKVQNPLVTRETMMQKFMSESEFYFFFVHGHHMQFWINAGNEATLLEWMVGGDEGWVGGDNCYFTRARARVCVCVCVCCPPFPSLLCVCCVSCDRKFLSVCGKQIP